jgi:hypothetical protein
VSSEVVLERRVEHDVALVVAEQIQVNLVEYAPHVKITFINGGKTPAWHLSVMIGLQHLVRRVGNDCMTNLHELGSKPKFVLLHVAA